MAELVAGQYSAAPSRSKNVALWVLQIAGAAMFLMAGTSKLAGAPAMVGAFGAIGWGQWFRYLTGFLEVAGAVALLIPALAGFGALWLTAVMAGAVLAHLTVLGGSPAVPVALLVGMAVVAWGRWDRTLRLFHRTD
ncbi:MAG: DoxX family protein [Bryobacterales bacterium]|jgi:putative oxidoreductase|nr:DoxX family protein [Bryobacterales bacterium]